MSMIEVDPRLFATCRLCLDEMGQYQIVPKVQMQIKYCFDIEVEPFDGLPQLICKKCEGILSQYDEIKKKYQEKQCGLRSNVKEGKPYTAPSITQQQDTVSSTQQVDNDSRNEIIKKNQEELCNNIPLSTARNSSSDRETLKDNRKRVRVKSRKEFKKMMSVWKNEYEKNFVCKFCTKSLKNKKSIVHHLQQCHLVRTYSNILRRCIIKMNKIDSKHNITFSNDNVVYGNDKIINSNLNDYYVLYTRKLDEKAVSTDCSDDDFTIPRRKRQRIRQISRSSCDTVINDVNDDSNITQIIPHSDKIEENEDCTNNVENEITNVSDAEFIKIDDSDSETTTRNKLNKPVHKDKDGTDLQSKVENDTVIQNIIKMCYNKYLKRLDMSGRNLKMTGNSDPFLQHKILSMGRKVIHDRGLNSTGLLRYMEHKDLEVNWIPKKQVNVYIRTTLKDNQNIESGQSPWKCLKNIDQTYVSKDFIDVFEENHRVRNEVYQHLALQDVRGNENNVTPNLSDSLHLNTQSHHKESTEVPKNLVSILKPCDRNLEISVLFTPTTTDVENQTILKKILNSNPVANPKQLPKKSTPMELYALLTNNTISPKAPNAMSDNGSSMFENNMDNVSAGHHMPIITSTVSLANVANDKDKSSDSTNDKANTESDGTKSQLSLPRIKVKPVTELMPENAVPRSLIVSTNSYPTEYYSKNQNIPVQKEITPMLYMTGNDTSYGNDNLQHLNMDIPSYSHRKFNQTTGPVIPSSSNKPFEQNQNKDQYVIMHTPDMPHTRTRSPYRYLQKLLKMHNIILLDSIEIISVSMSCLIKFKLVFHQESNVAVTLCLSVYCRDNTFVIRVMDIHSKHIDIAKLSAYWQWEILKEFRGNVVPKLFENAGKIGLHVFKQTSYFIKYLKAIQFTK